MEGKHILHLDTAKQPVFQFGGGGGEHGAPFIRPNSTKILAAKSNKTETSDEKFSKIWVYLAKLPSFFGNVKIIKQHELVRKRRITG